MRKTVMLILGLAIAGTALVGAQRTDTRPADSGEIELKAAMNRQLVEGDLDAAIEQYRAIVERYRVSAPSVAARALVQIGQIHQRRGRPEAQQVYQEILRTFPDQKDAVATARAQLGGGNAPARTTGDRAVWTGPEVDLFGQVSPDGRSITYVDWGGDQNLKVYDLLTHTERALTSTGPSVGFSQFAEFSAISRDGSQVAYAWYNERGQYDVRLVPLRGEGVPTPRVLFPGNADVTSIAPKDWSPDKQWIAVNIRRADSTGQIALVSVRDGSVRVLKSVDWRGANRILFSPDGRFVAYDLAADDSDEVRTIYVLAVDGSRERPLIQHRSRNVLMAWTPEGRHVLFESDRSGTSSLWAQSVAPEGGPLGEPTLVRRDIGSSTALGLTTSGTMFVYKSRSANYVQVASLDLDAGTITPDTRRPLFQRFVGGGGAPSWSRDGMHLVYRTCELTSGRTTCAIEIASPTTGEVRRVRPQLSYLNDLRLARDDQSFRATGRDAKGRAGLYRIDRQTGALSLLLGRPGTLEQWAPDESKLYFRRGGSVLERDAASGAERVLFAQRIAGATISLQVSPDGRSVASVERDAGATQRLHLIPVDGKSPVALLDAGADEQFDGYRLAWTPDSRAVVLPVLRRGSERPELWLVPVASPEQRRKLAADTDDWILAGGGFAIHPDGRRIAFTGAAGKQGPEVWALENVLPQATR